MNSPENPTPWQRRTIWRALTALAIAAIFAIAVGALYVFARALAFLQPILVPFAIAGVLAYLLEPVVARLVRFGTTRTRAVWAVFVVTTLSLVGFMFWLIPVMSAQSAKLARKVPEITYQVRLGVAGFAKKVRDNYGLRLVPDEFLEVPKPRLKALPPTETKTPAKTDPAPTAPPPAAPSVTPPPAPAPEPAPPPAVTPPGGVVEAKPATVPATPSDAATTKATGTTTTVTASEPPETPEDMLHKLGSGDWINDALPSVVQSFWNFLSASLGGFLGFFGFLLSLVIVPLYLFYLLTESPHISAGWSKYLPLRASAFKDEVVDCLMEINGYLIAFFRGQLVVSLINGVATGILLAVIGLDFGVLIGFALCFLGIIPYIGIILCWIPAVIIASVQGGSWLVSSTAAPWVFPVVVTGAFAIVQQIDALFVTPKIVGERVGLHPVTVIFSVFLWSLLLGGLLGAIIAVPLTATLKVILKRYVWERTLMAEPSAVQPIPISDK
jgi:predicted PurR-regulated permease PerM